MQTEILHRAIAVFAAGMIILLAGCGATEETGGGGRITRDETEDIEGGTTEPTITLSTAATIAEPELIEIKIPEQVQGNDLPINSDTAMGINRFLSQILYSDYITPSKERKTLSPTYSGRFGEILPDYNFEDDIFSEADLSYIFNKYLSISDCEYYITTFAGQFVYVFLSDDANESEVYSDDRFDVSNHTMSSIKNYFETRAAYSETLDLPLFIESNTYSEHFEATEESGIRNITESSYINGSENTFFIDENNVLTGLGDNDKGQIGNGTGVDIGRNETPAFILNDVANVYQFDTAVYAVKTDGSLWQWGDDKIIPARFGVSESVVRYEPTHSRDNIVKVAYPGTALSNEGVLYGSRLDLAFTPEATLGYGILAYNVKDYLITDVNNLFVIHGNGDWVHYSYNGKSYNIEILGTDVKEFKFKTINGKTHCHFIKNDNTLWAMGDNSYGMLGDGTKIDRDKPVKIADNVAEMYSMEASGWLSSAVYPFYLTTTGELWGWAPDKPIPEKLNDNVAAYYPAIYRYLYTDGTVKDRDDRVLGTGVKLPVSETVSFIDVPYEVKPKYAIGNSKLIFQNATTYFTKAQEAKSTFSSVVMKGELFVDVKDTNFPTPGVTVDDEALEAALKYYMGGENGGCFVVQIDTQGNVVAAYWAYSMESEVVGVYPDEALSDKTLQEIYDELTE